MTSELGHKHLVTCLGPRLCWELVGLCEMASLTPLSNQRGFLSKIMTQFWRHYLKSATLGNWVNLLMEAAVRATENSRYTNLLCCDQKLNLSIWIYYQHRWTFILKAQVVLELLINTGKIKKKKKRYIYQVYSNDFLIMISEKIIL